jgi:uncharacterized protein
MEQIIKISAFVFQSFLHIWPYLLVTIPLAVVINLSGASRYIHRAFGKNPLLSVLFATIVGAFSPFCSCGVIPVISSLLIGGVPLAPVMSFWIASPSMDPEIFFLSVSVIGWKLAVWRLASTFVISLLAGYITHFATLKGYIGNDVLRIQGEREKQNTMSSLVHSFRIFFSRKQVNLQLTATNSGSSKNMCCYYPVSYIEKEDESLMKTEESSCQCKDSAKEKSISKWGKLSREIMKATIMMVKFMGFAFLITALINFYLPPDLISWIVKVNPTTQVFLATAIGIPLYTSNLTALPIVGGLIGIGLNKGAALSFLIAGATTTLPAMVAVWGITKRRVFFLYFVFVLMGALLAGVCYNLLN